VFASRPAFALYGTLLAIPAVYLLKPHWLATQSGIELGIGAVHTPRVYKVKSDISGAISAARPGDTVLVAPGTYNEQIRLKDGVRLVSEQPRAAVLRANGVAISGEDIKSGRIEGFRIQPDDTVYLQKGIELSNCSLEIVDNEITGTVTAGIEVASSGNSVIRANKIDARSRAALALGGDGAGPRVIGNELSSEGHPAIVITGSAHPYLSGNILKAAEPLFAPQSLSEKELLQGNYVLPPEAGSRVTPPVTSSGTQKPATVAGGRSPAKPNASSRVR